MADLSARIKPKKSSTAGEVPQAADLEVAEIAVNTADGKLFVKHTDNSIVEISGGGGGGGTVDSVNDQTGVVSLGIQDMNDFELEQNAPGLTFDTWTDLSAGATISADGQVDGNGSGYLYFYGQGNDYTEMALLQVGDDLTITSGDGTQVTVQVTTAAQLTGGGATGYVITNGSWAPQQSTPPVPVTFESPRWGAATDIPLAEGDILKWDANNSKFKPAAPEVVTVNALATTTSANLNGRSYEGQSYGSVSGLQTGEIMISGTSYTAFHRYDKEGIDHQSEYDALSAEYTANSSVPTVYYSYDDGVTWASFVPSYFDNVIGSTVWRFGGLLPDYVSNMSDGNTLLMSFEDPDSFQVLCTNQLSGVDKPNISAQPILVSNIKDVDTSTPPAGDDVLVYNETDEVWRPGTLPLALSGLSDVQAAYAYPYIRNSSGSSFPASYDPGYYGVKSGYLYFHKTDANGVDHLTEYQGYDGSPPSQIYLSDDGGSTWSTTTPTYFDDALGTNVVFRFDPYSASTSAGEVLWISFGVDPSTADRIFKYDAASGYWREEIGSYIELSTLKTEVAASTDFADFQSRIAAL